MTEQEQKKKGPELINVEYDHPRKYLWSTGEYVGVTYDEAKKNKKIVSNMCPACKKILWPPKAVCGRCKVEVGTDFRELPQTGTVLQYTYLVYPLWDPHYGYPFANPYANAMIELDDGTVIRHFLEETDEKKLKEGMRVQAVWREDENDRGEGTADILYFKTIRGKKSKKAAKKLKK